MRCWQCMGFTSEAIAYLDQNVVMIPEVVCPKCGDVISQKRKFLSVVHVNTFYGDGPDLHTYEGKNGKKIKEIIQAEPWSSGPCSFLCLGLEDGTKIGEWSQEEIDMELGLVNGLKKRLI